MNQHKKPKDSTQIDPLSISRPDSALLKYFIISALLTGPLFPFVCIPLYFKYHTLRYSFDKDGISMSWGILFRKEIHLTYRRIQDIHLTRNFVQRWLGLATVAVQTASGKSGPEMSIEGILQADELRDYLYLKMRGAHDDDQGNEISGDKTQAADCSIEALKLLTEIRDQLKTRQTNQGARS
ncbi:PH domain-containing protein [bacterium]|nr:PH domain-containing protein [bacterium]